MAASAFPGTGPSDAGVNATARPSERLRLAADRDRTLGAVADALGTDAPFMLLLVLGALALVPGAAPVFAAGTIVIGSSLLFGRDRLALPDALRRRSIPKRTLDRAVQRLARVERHVRAGAGEAPQRRTRPFALLIIWNAVLVVLPIPFGNGPPAVASILIALGIVDRSGRALVAGVAATVAATVFEAALLWVGVDVVKWAWRVLGL